MPTNPIQHEIISEIADRWSPYRFDSRPVESQNLAQCFEAARWAASSFNEQPWSWIVATREDTDAFEKIVGCLMEANQGWAKNAGAIVLTVIKPNFSRNGKPNRVALHDLGQAAAHFALQAVALGLQVHQMAGVNLTQIRLQYQVPDEYLPQTAIAIGYPNPIEPTSEQEKSMAERESGARQRKPLADQVFSEIWGQASGIVGE